MLVFLFSKVFSVEGTKIWLMLEKTLDFTVKSPNLKQTGEIYIRFQISPISCEHRPNNSDQ